MIVWPDMPEQPTDPSGRVCQPKYDRLVRPGPTGFGVKTTSPAGTPITVPLGRPPHPPTAST